MQRNVFCPHYNRCLDLAIKEKAKGWDCTGCEFRHTKAPMVAEDIYRHGRLLSAIFEKYLKGLQK